MMRAHTAVNDETVADVDIRLRASAKRKLFLDDACPVCYEPLTATVSICASGHAMCAACTAKLSACAVCRNQRLDVVAIGDDEADAAFEATLACFAAMAPAPPTAVLAPNDHDALTAKYGACESNGVRAVLVAHPEPTAPCDLFVVIDRSGSMENALPQIDLRALFAECAAKHVTLCVVAFGDDARTVFGPAKVTAADAPPKLVAGGGTALHLALDHVRAMIAGPTEPEGPPAPVEPEAPAEPAGPPSAAQTVRASPAQVRIVTDGAADDAELARAAMRALTLVADVFLVATGTYVFANCSQLLENDTTKFDFSAPREVHSALAPTPVSVVVVPGDEASRMYRNGNVTAPRDGAHRYFATSAWVAFTGNVEVQATRDPALDFEVRRFLLAAAALAYVKGVTFDYARDGLARARKLASARKKIAKYGVFGEIDALIDQSIASIEDNVEASNSIARAASSAARACTLGA